MSKRIQKHWKLKHGGQIRTEGYKDEIGEDLSDLIEDPNEDGEDLNEDVAESEGISVLGSRVSDPCI